MVWFLGILTVSFVIGTVVLMFIDPREPEAAPAKAAELVRRFPLRPVESGLHKVLEGGGPLIAASGARHPDDF